MGVTERVKNLTENTAAIVTAVGSLVALLAGVAFGGYQYTKVHIPEFEQLRNQVTYQQCVIQCQDTCRANRVPLDRCDCRHCNVYRAH